MTAMKHAFLTYLEENKNKNKIYYLSLQEHYVSDSISYDEDGMRNHYIIECFDPVYVIEFTSLKKAIAAKEEIERILSDIPEYIAEELAKRNRESRKYHVFDTRPPNTETCIIEITEVRPTFLKKSSSKCIKVS